MIIDHRIDCLTKICGEIELAFENSITCYKLAMDELKCFVKTPPKSCLLRPDFACTFSYFHFR